MIYNEVIQYSFIVVPVKTDWFWTVSAKMTQLKIHWLESHVSVLHCANFFSVFFRFFDFSIFRFLDFDTSIY